MSGLFRYPGGKAKVKDIIIGELSLFFNNNLYTEYREPFFGGGSIGIEFMSKYCVNSIILNDKDNGIISLWKAIHNDHLKLIEYIKAFIPTKEIFYEFKDYLLTHTEEISTEIAFKKIAIHQISYSGLGTKSGGPLGGQKQESKYKVDCRWSPSYLIKKINHLHNIFSKVNIEFTFFDFEKVVCKESNNKVVMYLDPPYYEQGNNLYQFGFTIDDHKRLSNLLKDTKYDWVLSYDDCPEVRELYKWAFIKPLDINYTITNSRIKTELLIAKEEICQKTIFNLN